jgi:hypothetical protein
MNMLEKCARAMKANRFRRSGRESSIETMSPPTENEMDDARAVLLALRDPDEGMVEAMARAGWMSAPEAEAAFTAAIDHAAKGETQ